MNVNVLEAIRKGVGESRDSLQQVIVNLNNATREVAAVVSNLSNAEHGLLQESNTTSYGVQNPNFGTGSAGYVGNTSTINNPIYGVGGGVKKDPYVLSNQQQNSQPIYGVQQTTQQPNFGAQPQTVPQVDTMKTIERIFEDTNIPVYLEKRYNQRYNKSDKLVFVFNELLVYHRQNENKIILVFAGIENKELSVREASLLWDFLMKLKNIFYMAFERCNTVAVEDADIKYSYTVLFDEDTNDIHYEYKFGDQAGVYIPLGVLILMNTGMNTFKYKKMSIDYHGGVYKSYYTSNGHVGISLTKGKEKKDIILPASIFADDFISSIEISERAIINYKAEPETLTWQAIGAYVTKVTKKDGQISKSEIKEIDRILKTAIHETVLSPQ